MPLTLADWNAWPVEKRKFYVGLFTAYEIADDGVLCIDVIKRRDLVRLHLRQQDIPGAEQIITLSFSANYVLTDGLESDGVTLKKADDPNGIKVLCSKRSEALQASSQHILVGGFKSPGQPIIEHFKTTIKQKMCNGAEVHSNNIGNLAVLLPLGKTNDLTAFSHCSLHPDEKPFLLEDELFKAGIKAEAIRLAESSRYKVAELEQWIVKSIDDCSKNIHNQQFLAGLSVSQIHTYWALYTTKNFKPIEKYVKGILSNRGKYGFQGQSAPLSDYLAEGALAFTFLSEMRNLLKIQFILKGRLAGQAIENIKENMEKIIVTRDSLPLLIDLLLNVTKEQIAKIKDGNLPVWPPHMGIIWEKQRGAVELLKCLRVMQSMNLYHIAEMAGFSHENSHLAFGLEFNAMVDEINEVINQVWDAESVGLLRGVDHFLEKVEADPKASGLGSQSMRLATLTPAVQANQTRIGGASLFATPPIDSDRKNVDSSETNAVFFS